MVCPIPSICTRTYATKAKKSNIGFLSTATLFFDVWSQVTHIWSWTIILCVTKFHMSGRLVKWERRYLLIMSSKVRLPTLLWNFSQEENYSMVCTDRIFLNSVHLVHILSYVVIGVGPLSLLTIGQGRAFKWIHVPIYVPRELSLQGTDLKVPSTSRG